MRVVFVNRFYWPAEPATAQLLHDLTASLHARGWNVTVIAGYSAPGLPAREVHQGVEIIRIGREMAATQDLTRRALDFGSFHAALVPVLGQLLRRGDIVVALTDPPLIGVAVTVIAALRGAQVVHWVHDIYPEILTAVNRGLSARLAAMALQPLRDVAWQEATACVVLGADMAAVLETRGVPLARIFRIPNWAPKGIAPASDLKVETLRGQWNVAEKFVVGYAGNLGRVHDLTAIVETADRLRGDPRFVFLFIGHGGGYAELQRAVTARRLTNVFFRPPSPRTELSAALGVPDVHLVSVRRGCERFVFPSKIYGAAASGKPIVLLAAKGSEVAHTIDSHGLGAVFDPDDAPAISAYLGQLADDAVKRRDLKAAALTFDSLHGGCTRAVDAWDAVLRQVARDRAPARVPASAHVEIQP